MNAIARIPAAAAALAAIAVLASCADTVAPVDQTGGACTSDLACAYGEECGMGGCEPLKPSLYSHIQIGSALFQEYRAGELAWRAAHNDLMIHMVLGHVDEIRAVNPNARLFGYMYTRYHNYDDFGGRASTWAVEHGYNPEDFYLHYREDVTVPTWEGIVMVEGYPAGVTPGWNPDWSAGDPPASATNLAEARVPGYRAGRGADSIWKMANVNHPGYRRFLVHWGEQVLDGTLENQAHAGAPIDGIVFDNAIFYPQFGEGQLEKTHEYAGIPMNDQHPHALGFASLFPELTAGFAARTGRAVDVMPNFGHVLFTGHRDEAPQSVVETTPWIWCEVWVTHTGASVPTSGTARAITYEGDYVNAIERVVHQTRGPRRRVLGARDLSNGELGTDRGRMFTLALYYLVHNKNTWYAYESVPFHVSSLELSQWMWNPAVEFDIGQPDQIPAGSTDFDGNFPSNEHYVFATGPDPANLELTYRVLARRFTNALVLAKMLPTGSTVSSASTTTHDLDGSYAILQADGTLGEVVTQASIRNNEGLILIPVD